MKHFVWNKIITYDLWEYIWLEISTALPHTNCQLYRAVHIPPPPPFLNPRSGSTTAKVVLICYLLNLITGRQPVQVVE